MWRTLRNPLWAGALLSLVLAAGVFAQRQWGSSSDRSWLARFEVSTLDLRFRLRGPRPVGPEVAILAFDDQTFRELPALFERRAGWARVLRALRAAGPRAVGIDALFVQPERLLGDELQVELEALFAAGLPPGLPPSITGLLERLRREIGGDAELAAEIAALGRVVLGFHLGGSGAVSGEVSLAKAKVGQSVLGERPLLEGSALQVSQPLFVDAARALGALTVSTDASDTVRELAAARRWRGGVVLPLSVQLLAVAWELPKSRLAYLGQATASGRPELRLGAHAVELTEDSGVLLNYRGPAGAFPTHSVADLVTGRLPPEALRDRIVLIGYTFFGHDEVGNPFGDEPMPGVEVHATAIDNLLRADALCRAPAWLDALVCLVLGLVLALLSWPRWGLAPWWQALLGLSALGGAWAAGYWAFAAGGWWLLWSAPLGVFGVVFGSCLVLAYGLEGRQRRHLRRAFAHYLSDGVIEQLVAQPDALRLGGERRELTVLFSDIRGFTTISEGLAPEAVAELLNEYLTPMTEIVLAHNGTLDKYMGDAIMAFFGAPVPFADHAPSACRAALAMMEELERLRAGWLRRGLPALDIGIGINTGPMSVGNMGSARRFDYTVLGDHVNLGSRLEGLNKRYGTHVLVSQYTRERIGDHFTCRALDRVAVKGKRESVGVVELVHRGPPQPAGDGWIARFEGAVAAYRERRFAEALAVFEQLLGSRDDPPSRLYAERCRELLAAPPAADWDAVYRLESK